MLPQFLSHVVVCAKAHRFNSLEFEERGVVLWAFMHTWEDTFRWVAVAVTDLFSGDATHELSVLGSVVAAVGGSASLFALFGGSHVLADTYGKYLGSGYSRKLVEYPLFDLRLLKRCQQKVFFYRLRIIGSLRDDGNCCHAFEGAEHRDWIMSRSSLRHATITGELSMPSLLEVVSQHGGSVACHRGLL